MSVFARARPRMVATTAGEIPPDVHYRPATDPGVQCSTCAYFNAGHCSRFDASVSPSYVCDKWEKVEADHTARITASQHNRVLRAGEARARALEPRLAAALLPILLRAGDVAARNFAARAKNHLAGSAFRQTFAETDEDGTEEAVPTLPTMLAVKPRPEEAEALAAPYGEPAQGLHVTLVYLGKTSGPLDAVSDAVAAIPGLHAPLEGKVGGVGIFGDNGKGHPSIALPSVPGLTELRQAVAQALTAAGVDYGRDYGYVPHMTIGYADPDAQKTKPPDEDADPDAYAEWQAKAASDLAPDKSLIGQPLHFDDLWIVRGDTETQQLPLAGEKPLTASADLRFARCPSCGAASAELEEFTDGDLRCSRCAWAGVYEQLDVDQTMRELADVAESVAPDGGYGDTWWNQETAEVYWVCGDWTTEEEADAATEAFLAVDGVESVECCWECGAPAEGFVKVWSEGDRSHSLTAAAADDFCLPAELRTKSDPVRQAFVKAVMEPSLEQAGLAFDAANPLAARVLSAAGQHIVSISQTTQLDVMKVIRAGYDEGLSIPDTAKAIQAYMAEAGPVRATMIARTELAGAMNGGSLAATQAVSDASGGDYQKTWMTAPGAVYPRHENYDGLDGQTVALSDDFQVGDSQLQFPGDPGGDPGEVINCRCTMTYNEGEGLETSDAEDTPDLTASACEAHGLDPVDVALELAAIRSLTAAAGPAGWSSPAPEEVLRTSCDRPGSSAATGDVPAVTPTAVQIGAGPGTLSQATLTKIAKLGLNEWPPPMGAVGRRLFADAPAADKTTTGLYQHGGKWAADRVRVHSDVFDRHFEGKTPPPSGSQLHAYFTAGGGASGKSRLSFSLDGRDVTATELDDRADTIFVDPDRIKEMLPEYQALVADDDVYAAYSVHEESSAIAKQVVAEARRRGFNVVIDTTGQSDTFTTKIEGFKADGYETQVSMISVPTNEAIARSITRGEEKGRYIAMRVLTDAHAGSARQMERWTRSPGVDRWKVYDNSGADAVVVAEGAGGNAPTVYDQGVYDSIKAKADERTTG